MLLVNYFTGFDLGLNFFQPTYNASDVIWPICLCVTWMIINSISSGHIKVMNSKWMSEVVCWRDQKCMQYFS